MANVSIKYYSNSQSRGGRYGKNISLFFLKFHNFLSDSVSITKTNPFKVTKYKKVWWIFRPKWGKIKIFVIILSLLLKNKNKDTHYKYT